MEKHADGYKLTVIERFQLSSAQFSSTHSSKQGSQGNNGGVLTMILAVAFAFVFQSTGSILYGHNVSDVTGFHSSSTFFVTFLHPSFNTKLGLSQIFEKA